MVLGCGRKRSLSEGRWELGGTGRLQNWRLGAEACTCMHVNHTKKNMVG